MSESSVGGTPPETLEELILDEVAHGFVRGQHDIELIRDGAEIVPPTFRVEPTAKQEVAAKTEMYTDLKEKHFDELGPDFYFAKGVTIHAEKTFTEAEVREVICQHLGISSEDLATIEVITDPETQTPLDISFVLRPSQATRLYPDQGRVVIIYNLESGFFVPGMLNALKFDYTSIYEVRLSKNQDQQILAEEAEASFTAQKPDDLLFGRDKYIIPAQGGEVRDLIAYQNGEWWRYNSNTRRYELPGGPKYTAQEIETLTESRDAFQEKMLKEGAELSKDGVLKVPKDIQKGLWMKEFMDRESKSLQEQIVAATENGPDAKEASDVETYGDPIFGIEEIKELICESQNTSDDEEQFILPGDLAVISVYYDAQGRLLQANLRLPEENALSLFSNPIDFYYTLKSKFTSDGETFSQDATQITRIERDYLTREALAEHEATMALGTPAEKAGATRDFAVNGKYTFDTETVAKWDNETKKWEKFKFLSFDDEEDEEYDDEDEEDEFEDDEEDDDDEEFDDDEDDEGDFTGLEENPF